MPGKDTMLRLRQQLIRQRDELRKKIALEAGWTPEDAAHGDMADVAYSDHEQEMHSQLAALESRELSRLERAIEAINEGRYGTCEYCGGKIGLARLKAIPDAVACISCQQKHEVGGSGKQRVDWESAWAHEAREHDRELTPQDVRLDD